MFEYFPDNYAWSLAVMMAEGCGGAIDGSAEALFRLALGHPAD